MPVPLASARRIIFIPADGSSPVTRQVLSASKILPKPRKLLPEEKPLVDKLAEAVRDSHSKISDIEYILAENFITLPLKLDLDAEALISQMKGYMAKIKEALKTQSIYRDRNSSSYLHLVNVLGSAGQLLDFYEKQSARARGVVALESLALPPDFFGRNKG
jgi:hypothetical protein